MDIQGQWTQGQALGRGYAARILGSMALQSRLTDAKLQFFALAVFTGIELMVNLNLDEALC
jgi:hypothetical protein